MSAVEKASKVARKTAETISDIGKSLQEAGILPPKGGAGKQAPAKKTESSKSKTKGASKPAKVAARQYALRAIFYALLLTLGGMFLFMWLIKAREKIKRSKEVDLGLIIVA